MSDRSRPRRGLAEHWARLSVLLPRVGLACLLVLVGAGQASRANAQPVEDPLWEEFDARLLTVEEKRLLQIGLTIEGRYRGLLDGEWGRRSQEAIEAFVAWTDPGGLQPEIVLNAHAAELGRRAWDFLADTGLGYRGGPPLAHRLLVPPGRFEEEAGGEFGAVFLRSRDVTITIYDFLPFEVEIFHGVVLDDVPGYQTPYVVRTATRLVTAFDSAGEAYYARSDRDPFGGQDWYTTFIALAPGGDKRVFDTIIASLEVAGSARLESGEGLLNRMIRASLEPQGAVGIAATSPPQAPGPAEGHDLSVIGTGTGFFVNNTDLVTARHVVETCAALSLVDGTPVELVAMDPQRDLALLTARTRSRDWIALHATGLARLGQSVVALGYPYYGEVNTALNSTGGNVSALVGLHDDPETITISAPVQPGNSGGPLLATDGSVIGVVVAQLGKGYIAGETGSLPENINYAVTGAALLEFLEVQAVSLPRPPNGTTGLTEGISEATQRAIVPILCRQ
jgi:serine protease Do